MKDIVLIGQEKIKRDFEYIFRGKMDITEWKESISIQEVRDKLFIICRKRGKCKEEELLLNFGLHYLNDYIFVEDFLHKVNEIYLKAGEREIIVWGTGSIACTFIKNINKWMHPLEIHACIDNYKTGSFFDIQIKNPSEIKNWKDYFIIVAVESAKEEIYIQLKSYGLQEGEDFINYNLVEEDLEKLLFRTIFEERKYNYACIRPFGYTDIIGDNAFLCCPDMLPDSIGNIGQADFSYVWKSMKARILRLSVINGTYSFCNLQYCPERIDLRDKCNSIEDHYSMEALTVPDTMILGIDETCNLRCPSCREKPIIYSNEKIESQKKIVDVLLEETIPDVNNLWVAGCGEVFFSKLYRGLLNDPRLKKRKQLTILTNGTLANEESLQMVLGIYPKLNIMVSLDGIEKDTVEELRRGAVYEILIQNIEFLGKLRKENKISNLYISFVLQSKNINELYNLVNWCEKIGVDKICILKMHKHPHIMDFEFERNSVFDDDGRIKNNYRKYFSETLLNHPMIDWTSCRLGNKDVKCPQIYDEFDFWN